MSPSHQEPGGRTRCTPNRPVAKGGHFGAVPPAEVECPPLNVPRWMFTIECPPPLNSLRWVPPVECPPLNVLSAPSPPTSAPGIPKTSPIRKTSPIPPPPRIRKTSSTAPPPPRIRCPLACHRCPPPRSFEAGYGPDAELPTKNYRLKSLNCNSNLIWNYKLHKTAMKSVRPLGARFVGGLGVRHPLCFFNRVLSNI